MVAAPYVPAKYQSPRPAGAEIRLVVVHCTISPEQGNGAEAVASTLDRKALIERFLGVLQQVVKHQQGVLLLASGQEQRWGGEILPQPELVTAARRAGRPVRSSRRRRVPRPTTTR